jgi:transcriptional regulator with XRE-family HTH domain
LKHRDREYAALLEEERLILDATEAIQRLMDEQAINRTELARRIGVTKGHVSQLLDGKRNMTLRTLAGLLWTLGHRARIETEPVTRRAFSPQPMLSHKVHAYVNSTRRCSAIKVLERFEGTNGPAWAGLIAPVTYEGSSDIDTEFADFLAGAA